MEFNQDLLIDIAKKAGSEILEIYNDPNKFNVVDHKADDSPLTLADKASHQIIARELENAYPEVPIISEESEVPDYKVRREYNYYFLIDPLDGTKEFINRNGQFTVNIAVIKKSKPIIGVVYTPVSDELYFGELGVGAFKLMANIKKELAVNNKKGNRIAVRSKSHASPEEEGVLEKYDVVDSISVGSSLKFCMVAEGKADVYYRHGPTMEWDTAAGQAVVEAAGGSVYRGTGPEMFSYNKENLLNSSFLCLGFD
ncbi:3'(2'),5'-bisphosphate nucleotidase CysQ [Fulvivirga lutea]|uniref:3'(2'),5'-bisphosphate nucleotidase CysQ n=1 Tax=Fulvivirga lutea TaxID=2810512 RepID=A0A975A1F6_9BACT|nr:3'(2'),5'-bisphosphate nucleotidase CysQ [Fulvivirga lutea]QSE98394.1 3'(2'),5'-bisphosphate nucleotidase CysQ [Fulvivirga lutea]